MSNPDVLYHYCSTEAFKAIIDKNSVQLSSVTLSNDTAEGKLVAGAFQRLAQREGLAIKDMNEVRELIETFQEWFDRLAFCFSEHGDLLSQWRGYAAGGAGVAIGFSTPYLTALSDLVSTPESAGFFLGQVHYDSTAHETEIEPVYQEMVERINDGALRHSGGMLDMRTETEKEEQAKRTRVAKDGLWVSMVGGLYSKLFFLKSNAFREEHEWRLISMMFRHIDQTCSYRASQDKLVPFRAYDLVKLEHPPLAEVVLGPKHMTPVVLVENFLRQSGFNDVKVRRSEATFR